MNHDQTTLPACMGGWCAQREHCQNYHAGAGEPIERLCEPGRDGKSWAAVVMVPRMQEQPA